MNGEVSQLEQLVKEQEERVSFYYSTRGSLPEADGEINAARYAILDAYVSEKGAAWIGRINRMARHAGTPYLRLYSDGEGACAFEARIAVPCNDEQIKDLIRRYNEAPSIKSHDAIMDRTVQLGGVVLFWT
jgi:hypothetical protein